MRELAFGLTAVCVASVSGHAQTGGTPTRIDHVTLAWVDSTRPEPWTPDSSDHRAMLVQVFYRAGAHEAVPLILFSTGRDEGPSTYTDLANALVRDGYVVAIVDHLGERSGQRLPNDVAVPNLLPRVAPDRASPSFALQDSLFTRRWVELRAADITSARVHLQALAKASGNELSGLLNGQTAAIGHSLGGLSSAKACERDPAFSACANLDGLSYSLPMHVDGEAMVATQPFLFLGKPIPRLSDATLERDHMTRAEDDAIVARMTRRFDALMQSARAGSYRVLVQGADHMNFAGAGNGTIAKTIREYLLAFLDKHLRGVGGTVLDAAASNPAVAVTRYAPRLQQGGAPTFDSLRVRYEFGCDHADCPAFRMLVTWAGMVTLQFDTVRVRDQLAEATLTTLQSGIADVQWAALPDSVPMSFCAEMRTHQPEFTVEMYWPDRQSRVTDSRWCAVISQEATEPKRRARDAVRQLRDVEDALMALPAVAEAMRGIRAEAGHFPHEVRVRPGNGLWLES